MVVWLLSIVLSNGQQRVVSGLGSSHPARRGKDSLSHKSSPHSNMNGAQSYSYANPTPEQM